MRNLIFLFFIILKYITSIHRAFRLLHSLQWIQGLTKVIHAMSDTTAYYSQMHTRQNQWQELLYHMQSFINRSVTRKPHHVDAWKIRFLSLQKNMDQMMMHIELCLCNCLHSPRGREMRNFRWRTCFDKICGLNPTRLDWLETWTRPRKLQNGIDQTVHKARVEAAGEFHFDFGSGETPIGS